MLICPRCWVSRIAPPVLAWTLGLLWECPGRAQTPPPADAGGSTTSAPAATARVLRVKSSSKTRCRQLREMVKQLSTRVEELSATVPARPGGRAIPGRNGRRDGRLGERGRGRDRGGAGRAAGPGGLARRLRVFGRIGGAAGPARTEANRPIQHAGPGPGPAGPRQLRAGIPDPDRRRRVPVPVPRPDAVRRAVLPPGRAAARPHARIVIPREWLIFAGRLTRPFEYYVAIAEGIDNLNLLDAYLNINFDPRIQFKIGRYKTPFTYEFYALGINSFPTPERSLFYNNFGLNRDLGIMAFGQLFENRFDYAFGSFNGTRNGFIDSNDFKDVAGLVNFRPLREAAGLLAGKPQLRRLVRLRQAEQHADPPGPADERRHDGEPGDRPRVPGAQQQRPRERRPRLLVAAPGLVLSAPLADRRMAERVPGLCPDLQSRRTGRTCRSQSYYVTAAYFLTGETVSGRGILKPIRNFDLRKGKFGLGAVEAGGAVQLPQHRPAGLHQRPGRPEPLDQPALHDPTWA